MANTDLEHVTVDALAPDTNDGPSPPGDGWQHVLNLTTQWLAEHRGNSRSAYADAIGYPVNVHTGQRRDTSTLRNGVAWLPWCLGHHVDPLDARRRDVVAWINALDATPHPTTGRVLSKSTRSHMVSAVSAFYLWLVQEGHTEINPVQVNRRKLGVSTSGDASPTRSLSAAEVARLQTTADHDRIESVRNRSAAIVAMLFGVGMRVSELVALDLDDLKVMQGHPAIPLTLKGNRVHWSAVPPQAMLRLDTYLASRGDTDKRPTRMGQVGNRERPMFITQRGRRLHRTTVNELLKRLARDAGLADPDSISPHVGRHSFITGGREVGLTDSALQHQVGHGDAKTTSRYGVHSLNLAASPVFAVADHYLPNTPDAGA